MLMKLGRHKIHRTEPLVPEHSPFKVETAVEKLKRYISNTGRTDASRKYEEESKSNLNMQ
jgi:hypothetical protein